MHWMNSAFQTLYFLVGKCHTFDEAYRVVLQQLEERVCSLEETREKLNEPGAIRPHQGSARLARLDSMIDVTTREIRFLETLARRIEPLRKYRHLDLHDANQMAQRDQWLGEFMDRIENYVYATGGIPPDALDAMRLHPDYQDVLVPHLKLTMSNYKADALPPPKRTPVMAVMKVIEHEQLLALDWKPKEIAA